MSESFDVRSGSDTTAGIAAAARALRNGELVVLPTDTVYGVAADAFSPPAVQRLLAAKGRERDMPVPVLVGTWRTVNGLVDEVPKAATDLIAAFWPGALTLVLRQADGLTWDLGENRGTVAVRMPLHQVAIDVLTETGPLAVSSANKTGQPAPASCQAAREQLGDDVAVYLDGGAVTLGIASTIVDLTGATPQILREGSISRTEIEAVIGGGDG